MKWVVGSSWIWLVLAAACGSDSAPVGEHDESSSSSVTSSSTSDAGETSSGSAEPSSSTDPALPPDLPPGDPNPHAVALSLGITSSCATFDDGELRCWGGGDVGSAEEGEPAYSFGAPEVGGVVLGVTDGGARCAWLDTDYSRCWNTTNANGMAGYGFFPAVYGDDEDPVLAPPLELGIEPTRIVAGLGHVCAFDDRGALVCWGGNEYGQLGYGHTETIGDDETPLQAGLVAVGGAVTAVSAGGEFTCALRGNGAVCWGAGGAGRLGQGEVTPDDAMNPAMLPSIALGGVPQSISAGNSHACAVLEGGDVRCWGRAESGVLGLGTGDDADVGDDETPGSVPPVDIGGIATAVACGYESSCVLLQDGAVRCWGTSSVLGLGMGAVTIGDDETPTAVPPVELPRPAVAISVSKFAFGHACAILDDGTLRCWGDARGGALGYEDTEDIGDDETPIALPPVPVFPPPR